jgi:hypothetical protein
MGTIASDKGGNFERCPEGNHIARCYHVVDLGLQATPWGPKQKVRIAFELPNELMKDGENEGKPFSVASNYTLSLNEKANLRKHLEAWRGKSFTDEELQGFDIKTVLGHPCMIQVIHNTKGDRTYANIASIATLPKGMEAPAAVNEPLYVNAETITDEELAKLPEWLQKKINRTGEVDMSTQAPPTGHPAGEEDVGVSNNDLAFDDDIPFS